MSSNATRPSLSQKKQCFFLVFRNNFEEITNTSLFLLIKTIRLFALNFYDNLIEIPCKKKIEKLKNAISRDLRYSS